MYSEFVDPGTVFNDTTEMDKAKAGNNTAGNNVSDTAVGHACLKPQNVLHAMRLLACDNVQSVDDKNYQKLSL